MLVYVLTRIVAVVSILKNGLFQNLRGRIKNVRLKSGAQLGDSASLQA
jgi:hypothetical protein